MDGAPGILPQPERFSSEIVRGNSGETRIPFVNDKQRKPGQKENGFRGRLIKSRKMPSAAEAVWAARHLRHG